MNPDASRRELARSRKDVGLLIMFGALGEVRFYPVLDTAEGTGELARRFQRLCAFFIENPSVLRCAAGLHEPSPDVAG